MMKIVKQKYPVFFNEIKKYREQNVIDSYS